MTSDNRLDIRQTNFLAPVAMTNLSRSCVCSCMSMAGECATVQLCNYDVQMFMADMCAIIYSTDIKCECLWTCGCLRTFYVSWCNFYFNSYIVLKTTDEI